ncbi:MAG: hypothetical protein VKQ33_15725 [Candidatus Sericytochromatia bacterium]|nr:hypothetical protein [Candidatus Sericytochromatia bacterium]
MSCSRFIAGPLAASVALAALALPAEAQVVAYDARTLALGGNTVGYAGNASLAYWNPAAVGNSRNFGLFLPTLGVSLNNNVLGVAEAASLLSSVRGNSGGLLAALGRGGTTPALLTRLGSAEGLNIRAQTLVEPFGLAFGVGPGSVALRVYGGATAVGAVNLSPDFAADLNNLVFENGFADISAAANKVAASAGRGLTTDLTTLRSDVTALRAALEKNMKSFIIDGRTKRVATKKDFTATVASGVTGTVAATYAQPLPLPKALTERLPEAQLTVGVTGKVLQNGAGLLTTPSGAGGAPLPLGVLPLPGGSGSTSNATFNALSGSAAIRLDMDREVTDLVNAIGAFDQAVNLATVGELLGSVQAFTGKGLTRSSLVFSSETPDNTGVAADVGAHLRFNRWWSLGVTLVNPVLFWNARKTTYRYAFDTDPTSANALSLVQDGPTQTVAFRVAEPFAVRAGVALTPQFERLPASLLNDSLVTAGLDAPILTGLNVPGRPVLSIGVEKRVGPLALRVGTQQLGFAPMYTAGLGLQTRWVQLNAGAGADPSLRGAAGSVTLGVGF